MNTKLENLIEALVKEELSFLLERRRAKPVIMYHGTSPKVLPKIFQLGVVPNPTKGRWKSDEEFEKASIHSPSLHSLEGSYWTNNILTAYSSGKNASPDSKFAIIIAQIVPQSAKSDEDDIRIQVQKALATALGSHFGARDISKSAVMAKGQMDAEPSFFQELFSEFAKQLHNNLKTNDKMPFDKALLRDAFEAAIERILGHVDMKGRAKGDYIEAYEYALGKKINDWNKAKKIARNKYKKDDIPTYDKVSGERNFLQILDKLSSRYRKYATDQSGFNSSLRITSPVGFSGRNKIIGIVVGTKNDDLELVYGHLPQKFIKDYSNSWGPNFKVTDRKTGKILYDNTD